MPLHVARHIGHCSETVAEALGAGRLHRAVEIHAEPAHAAFMEVGELLGRDVLRIDHRDTAAVAVQIIERLQRHRVVGAVEARLHDDEAGDAALDAEPLERVHRRNIGDVGAVGSLRMCVDRRDDVNVTVTEHEGTGYKNLRPYATRAAALHTSSERWPRVSLRFDVRGLHRLVDVLDLALERLVEDRAVTTGHGDTRGRHLPLGLRRIDGGDCFRCYLVEDRLRHAGSRIDTDDSRKVVARNDVRDRRNVGRLRPAGRSVVGEEFHLLAFHRADKRRIGGEQHRHMAAEQRGHRLARAAIRHVSHLETERRLHRLHRNVMDAADAGRSVVDLARPRLHVVDELTQRRHRQVRMRSEEQRRLAEQRDRNHILWIVRKLLEQRGVRRHKAAVGDHERVAVRGRAKQRGRRGRGAAARSVLDHHRLPDPLLQMLRGDTRHCVRQTARCKRHDEADALVRIRRLRRERSAQNGQRENRRGAQQTQLHGIPPRVLLVRAHRQALQPQFADRAAIDRHKVRLTDISLREARE